MTKPTIQQLRRLQSSPAAFRSAIVIDSDTGPKRLANVVEPWQAADFAAMDGGWQVCVGQKPAAATKVYQRGFLCRPRGHSKTSDISIQIVWALFAASRKVLVVCAAADRDQSRLIRDAVQRLVMLNSWLKDYVSVQDCRVVNPHTDSTCDIISSDEKSSFGILPDAIIADEFCHWSDRGLLDSLLSSAAKRANCLFLVITNAGAVGSFQWDFQEAVKRDPEGWYFNSLDGPQASWITPQRLAEQQRLLPSLAFDRLWLNRWSAGAGDFLSPADIDAAVTQTGPMDGKELGYSWVGGLDIGISHDASAFIVLGIHTGHTEVIDAPQRKTAPINRLLVDAGILQPRRQHDEPQRIQHPGTGRIRLAAVQVWQPSKGLRVDLSSVESAIVAADKQFKLSACACDPWQSALMVERLQKLGLSVYSLQQTGITLQAQASAVLDVFRERLIDLFPCEALLSDLRACQVASRSYGFRIVSPKISNMNTHQTAHGDCSTSFQLALLAARRAVLHGSREIQGRLVCWPSAVA